jgi:hypothetical protein
MDGCFTFSHSILTGIHGFWTDDVENSPDTVKYKVVEKLKAERNRRCRPGDDERRSNKATQNS